MEDPVALERLLNQKIPEERVIKELLDEETQGYGDPWEEYDVEVLDTPKRNSRKALIKQGSLLLEKFWNEFGWKEVLEDFQINWQELMKAYKHSQGEFLKWDQGHTEWEDAVDHLIDNIVYQIYQ